MITNRRAFFSYAAAPIVALAAPDVSATAHRVADDIAWPDEIPKYGRNLQTIDFTTMLRMVPPPAGCRSSWLLTSLDDGRGLSVTWGTRTAEHGLWRPISYQIGPWDALNPKYFPGYGPTIVFSGNSSPAVCESPRHD